MVIVVDTNALVADSRSELSHFCELSDYALKSNCLLALPEVALVEFNAWIDRQSAEYETHLKGLLRKLPPTLQQTLDVSSFMREVQSLKQRLRTRVQNLIRRKRAVKIRLTESHARGALHRAVNRKAPCSASGEELRDAMIWEASLQLAKKSGGPLVLLSGDNGFSSSALDVDAAANAVELIRFPSIGKCLAHLLQHKRTSGGAPGVFR